MRSNRACAALGLGLAALASLVAPPARGADHRDGPAVTASPEADINDVYAWMGSDGKTLYLAMTVFPGAGATAKFSDAVYYVFHTSSRAKLIDPTVQPTQVDVICKFDGEQRVQCWGGGDYVSGNASVVPGILSRTGKLRAFAGLRQDPFFFNQEGFNAVRATVKGAFKAGQITTVDTRGCPTYPMRAELVSQLKEQAGKPGSTPVNAFANQNVLALIVGIDVALVKGSGPIVGVWGSTYRANSN